MRAYIISVNNDARLVVLDSEAKAQDKLQELKERHLKDHDYSSTIQIMCRWTITEVPYL